MADESEQKREPGVALIKTEYLLVDYKPVLNTEYVSTEVQKQLDEAANQGDNNTGEPPNKRIKIKGRNKKRPRERKIDPSNKLCPSILREKECSYGDKCKFSHNCKEFVASQPDNIGSECHLFETYGKCPYWLACRFSKAHLTEDLKNVAKENLESYKSRESTVTNVLKKDLQVSLWKRRYDFSRADKILDIVSPGAYDQKRRKEKKRQGDKSTKQPQENKVSENNVKDSKEPSGESSGADSNVIKQEGTAETVAPETTKQPQENKVSENNVKDSKEPSGESSGADSNVIKQEGTTETVAPDNGAVGPHIEKEGDKLLMEAFSVNDFGEEAKMKALFTLRPQEKKKIDFKDKLYLAPLTTVGNLPFRRICKEFGVDVTCGEMAVCTNLLQGQQSEWALLKRHESEDLFGVQLCGGFPDAMTRCAQLITETMDVDFIDINCGCPIDLIFNRGEGSALMGRLSRFDQIIKGMTTVMDVPLTVKLRTGIYTDKNIAHTLMPRLRDWGVALTTLHGRSRVQRYTRTADWDYINECATAAAPMPLFGNGDIMSYEEANLRREQTGVSGIMLARGALIKPWVFTEIKEQRHWDISSSERFDMLKKYANYGFDHWGSDTQGVENTRRFLLEWLSFLYRYIPVGLLERLPQMINEKPPYYKGRDDLETLMASPSCSDWIKISEMLLGPVPEGFNFLPKHKANAYK